MKKEKRGFTLIELLATILIISLIMGISGMMINNTIKKSNERKEAIALNNIKKTASTYIEEYPNDIIWNKEDNISYSCISVNSLIEKGYFTKKNVEESKVSQYIIVKKNQANAIIGEEFDDNNSSKCNNNKTIVKIPTAKEYCSNPEYSGKPQSLTYASPDEFSFEDRTEIEVGSYEVKATLKDTNAYVWKDYTTTPKTIRCTIQKATPLLWNPEGEDSGTDGKELGEIVIHLNSSVDGTLSIKSSNKSIATASFNDGTNKITATINNEKEIINQDDNSETGTTNNPEEGVSGEGSDNTSEEISTGKEITIKILSTSKTTTYITFELTPTDNSRYKKATYLYTIGEVNKKKIPIPTCQNELYETENYQTLVSPGKGYTLLNNIGKTVGKYEITAQLKYGYIWEDDSKESKKIECNIKSSSINVTYDSNGGSRCNPLSKEVTYHQKYNTLCKPTKTGYDFDGWNENQDGSGKEITENTIVTTGSDHTIYAQWQKQAKKYTLTYNSNGGSACNPGTKTIVENGTYGSLCTTSRPGYRFDGWYTLANGGSKVVSSTIVQNKNHIIYAHWTKTDNTAPTCGKQSPSVTSWTKKSRTITVKCTDNKGGSGCEKTEYSRTYNSANTETKESVITIKDKAGNEKNCKIKVMVDKKAPTIKITSKKNYSYQSNKKYCTERKTSTYQKLVIIEYHDDGSGLKSANFTWPKGCIGCSNVGNQTFSRDCSGAFRYQKVTEGLCGRNGNYNYKICDIVGNCVSGKK